MSVEEQRRNGAISLLEALSGVDEELLAKCEGRLSGEAGGLQGMEKGLRRHMPAWATLAAAVCVLAVGIYTWQLNVAQTTEKMEAVQTTEKMEAAQATGKMETAPTSEAGTERADLTVEDNLKPEREEVTAGLADVEAVAVTETEAGRELTETEAAQVAILGEYVPHVLPQGYAWETGWLYVDEEGQEGMRLTWTKGSDYISLTFSRVDVEKITLAQVEQPEEYEDKLHNPVFAAADLCEEVVEARMKAFADRQDTGSPEGNFSVLYEGGVLISFNGRGVVQEIWELFASLR